MTRVAKPIATKEGKPVYAFNLEGRPVCGAKTKRGTCQSPMTMSNGRCRIHSGGSPKGILSPKWKGSTASVIFKELPAKLQRAYLASLSDKEQLSLQAGIAMLDANTVRLIQQLNAEVGPDVYKRFADKTLELDALLCDPFPDWYEVRRAWSKLLHVAESGSSQAGLWAELSENWLNRTKLSEVENKRQIQLEQTVTAKEFDTVIAAILNIVKTTVTIPRDRATAGRKILALIAPAEAAKLELAQDIVDTEKQLVAKAIPANAEVTDTVEDYEAHPHSAVSQAIRERAEKTKERISEQPVAVIESDPEDDIINPV